MKKIALVIGVLVALLGGIIGYFMSGNSVAVDSLSIVPSDAAYIIQSNEPVADWNEFSSSSFWQFLKTHPSLKSLSSDADYLDNLLSENATALKHIGKRNFILSAHMIGNGDYDFLVFIDLKDAAKFQLNKQLLAKVVEDRTTKLYEHTHKSIRVFEILDTKSKDMLYMTQLSNHLIFSYSRSLLHRCIEAEKQSSLPFDSKFTEMTDQVDANGLFRLYLNYTTLPHLVGYYSSKGEKSLANLTSEFSYSGFDIQSDDESLTMQGYTSLDTASLYARLLQKHGGGKISFDRILSGRTGYCQALFLSDFDAFYRELLPQLEEEKSVQSFREVQQKVEKVLGLSLENDFLSWIGDEVVLAQHQPSSIHRNSEDDLIVAIRASSISLASEKLMHVQKQIKKRTPVKFKKLDYKNYNIYYLDINGFFGLFFGKAFDKLTKPYYTIIEDFVVFSNSPKTLASMIEDYENNYTLSNDLAFLKVKENLPTNHSLFTYINGPNSYPILGKMVNPNERSQYAKNKPYLAYLNATGISFSASGDGFKNKLFIHFNKDATATKEVVMDATLLIDNNANLKNLSDAELFVMHQINDGDYVKYYPNSDVAILTAETKNGLFHGKYTEYYPNGVLKVEGKYRKGKKSGRWKYYSIDGKLEEKKWE